MNIGSVIMSKRKALGYTQQTLANKLNVSFQAVSKWENGGSVSLDFRRTFYALS